MLGGGPGEPRAPGGSGAARPGLAHTRQLQAAAPAGGAGPGSQPRPSGEPEGVRGEGSGEPGGTRPPAPGPASPRSPPLQLLGAYDPLLSFPPREPRTKPELCHLPAGTGRPSRRAAGGEVMPVSGTEQERAPSPRQPLPGCVSAGLHEQHVPTWAGAVCSVALTAPSAEAPPSRAAWLGACPKSGGSRRPPRHWQRQSLSWHLRACPELGKQTCFLFFAAEKTPWPDSSNRD